MIKKKIMKKNTLERTGEEQRLRMNKSNVDMFRNVYQYNVMSVKTPGITK